MDHYTVHSTDTHARCIVGGEVEGLTKLTGDTREELVWELKERAARLGANAVLGLHVETSPVFDGVLDIVCFGTAVTYTK